MSMYSWLKFLYTKQTSETDSIPMHYKEEFTGKQNKTKRSVA